MNCQLLRLLAAVVLLAANALPTAAQGRATLDPAPKTGGTLVEIGPANLFPYRPGVDVEHYDVAIALPATGTVISATSTITVRRQSTIDTLRLDLIGMIVDGVTVAGQRRAFRRDSTHVLVPLRTADGVRVRIAIRYHGSPSDGLIIREDSTRGWSAFGDNWPTRARFWLPTVDHPSDKATITWAVSAPVARSVIANGDRVSRTLAPPGARADGVRMATTRFSMRQPIPTYLMVIGVAVMREHALGNTACGAGERGACIPQSVWTFPAESGFVPGPFAEAGRIVRTFAKLAGPYAYTRLAHVQSATRFGGMENATAIFYSDNAFRNRSLGVPLVAHETAHQWFGDAVTPRRWPDLWLSEGFASYLTPLYLRTTRGDSAFLTAMRAIREEIIAAPVVEQRPVVDSVGAETPTALLNANSYQKGAFVLHMLRAEVGDSAFFRALRDYQARYRNATATTDDFRRIVERRHGASLDAFFAQWLHRPGWAELGVRWRWDASASTLRLTVSQGTRFAPFAVPLTLVVRDADGRESVVRVNIAAQLQQELTVPVRGIRTPTSIGVDPDVLLLGRIKLERDTV